MSTNLPRSADTDQPAGFYSCRFVFIRGWFSPALFNFRNLSRYCDYSERAISRQFRREFDWPDFHQRVISQTLKSDSVLISAQDASFIPKSGKQTFGLGYFFNGCHSRPERGLEISTLAVIDLTRRFALTLALEPL